MAPSNKITAGNGPIQGCVRLWVISMWVITGNAKLASEMNIFICLQTNIFCSYESWWIDVEIIPKLYAIMRISSV